MSSKSTQNRLPFEPRKKKRAANSAQQTSASKNSTKSNSNNRQRPQTAIPDVVSRRMARRMAFFCGIPTAVGLMSFVLFYWLKTHTELDLPPWLVIAVSIGFFVVGGLGLSYGLFSASWDEERIGGRWGIQEFKLNFSRTTANFRNQNGSSATK